MAVYVVTWNLNKEKGNYNTKRENLFDLFSKFNRCKPKALDSVIFIETNYSAHDIIDKISLVLDENDTLLVSKLNQGEYNGLLSDTAWDWISERA